MLACDPAQARVASYGLALRLYSAHDAASVAARPRLRDGLVDIPVAIPDDETMVENSQSTGRTYLFMTPMLPDDDAKKRLARVAFRGPAAPSTPREVQLTATKPLQT